MDGYCRRPGPPISHGAPAWYTMSASPVASTNTRPRTARKPCLVAITTASIASALRTTPAIKECSSGVMRGSAPISRSARRLYPHGTYGMTAVSLYGTGPTPIPAADRPSAHSRAMPSDRNSLSSPTRTYSPQIDPRDAAVALPPKKGHRSTRATLAPARAAARAAPSPADPAPHTTTSASRMTGASASTLIGIPLAPRCARRSRSPLCLADVHLDVPADCFDDDHTVPEPDIRAKRLREPRQPDQFLDLRRVTAEVVGHLHGAHQHELEHPVDDARKESRGR